MKNIPNNTNPATRSDNEQRSESLTAASRRKSAATATVVDADAGAVLAPAANLVPQVRQQPPAPPHGQPPTPSEHSPAYWIPRLNRAAGKCTESLLRLGFELTVAKKALAHGQWIEMFNSGKLNLSLRSAQRLMQIAAHPALSNTTNSSHLPPSPDALLALAVLPPAVVAQGIREGRITAQTTIAAAKQLATAARRGNGVASTESPELDFDDAYEPASAYLTRHLARVPDRLLPAVVGNLTADLRGILCKREVQNGREYAVGQGCPSSTQEVALADLSPGDFVRRFLGPRATPEA